MDLNHGLAEIISLLFTAFVGLIVGWLNNKIFVAVTRLSAETSEALGRIRITQMEIQKTSEGHAILDEIRFKEADRRIDRLEDRRAL